MLSDYQWLQYMDTENGLDSHYMPDKVLIPISLTVVSGGRSPPEMLTLESVLDLRQRESIWIKNTMEMSYGVSWCRPQKFTKLYKISA